MAPLCTDITVYCNGTVKKLLWQCTDMLEIGISWYLVDVDLKRNQFTFLHIQILIHRPRSDRLKADIYIDLRNV